MNFETKAQMLLKLRNQVQNLSEMLNSREKALQVKESRVKQGLLENSNVRNLETNLNNVMSPYQAPGNVGDINKTVWPFFFTTNTPSDALGQNETFQTGFSVTQEAAFIFTSFTKCVYLANNNSWGYLDPNTTFPNAPGLTFTLRDGSSSRQFFDRAIDLDQYGNPRFPTKFPKPVMLLPNQVMQISFFNSHPTNEYVPFITALGVRVRVEDSQRILSLIYG